MKAILSLLLVASTILSAQAQSNNYHLEIVGYYNYSFHSGENLFHNNLSSSSNTLNGNTLNAIFHPATTPVGTTVSTWHSGLNTYDTTAVYLGGGVWTTNLTLLPGTGAVLSAPSAFTNTFFGVVLDHNGNPFDGFAFHDPAPFAGPNGLYLLGDKAPLTSAGNDIFMHVLGRAPRVGEQFTTLNGTSTYLGSDVWDTIPQLKVGEAAFFNIVPEPSTIGLSLLAAASALTRFLNNRKR